MIVAPVDERLANVFVSDGDPLLLLRGKFVFTRANDDRPDTNATVLLGSSRGHSEDRTFGSDRSVFEHSGLLFHRGFDMPTLAVQYETPNGGGQFSIPHYGLPPDCLTVVEDGCGPAVM